MAWVVRHDRRGRIRSVPIQSPLGAELLADLDPPGRLRSAHVIRVDGSRCSGGAAVAEVLSALPRTFALGRLARGLPGTTDLLYRAIAARRETVGRLVGAAARRRADELLAAARTTTSAELAALDSRSRYRPS